MVKRFLCSAGGLMVPQSRRVGESHRNRGHEVKSGASRRSEISRLVHLLVGSSALTGLAAVAQAASPGDDTPALQEIVVTATKRSEDLQNVPFNLVALDAKSLEQHQVANLDDYVKSLPSVSFQSFGPGQSQLYFRGISTGIETVDSLTSPASSLYVDETPLTTISGTVDLHVYDVARVEALSGPQGTLYGASSLSGTLRIITNQPDTSGFSAGYDLDANKYGPGGPGGQVEGFVNIPLNDRAALRVVGFFAREGGYIDNTIADRTYLRPHTVDDAVLDAPLTVNNSKYAADNFNDITTYGGRAALKLNLNDSWTVTPSAIYQHQLASGTFLYDPLAGDLQVHDFTPENNLDDCFLGALTVQGKISDWDLTYAGSYFNRTKDNTQDYSYYSVAYDSYVDYNYLKDASGHDIDPTQIFHAHNHYIKESSELRILSPASERLRLTAGLFYQRQSDAQLEEYRIPGLSTASVATILPIPGAPPDDAYYTGLRRTDTDYAIFGELAYDLSEKVTVTAGARGFVTENSILGFTGGQGSLTSQTDCLAQTVQACPDFDKHYRQTGQTHKVNLSWHVTPEQLLYFTYSTGFRPGGNNRGVIVDNLGRTQSIPSFLADTIDNFEVGWKTSWLDNSLRFNGALFWENWHNVQYTLPGLLAVNYIVNAGAARSQGVETNLDWQVDRHLTLSAAGAYTNARLVSDFVGTDGVVQAPSGTRLPIQPKISWNATARYSLPTGNFKEFVQASVRHQSDTTQYLTTAGEAVLGPASGFTTVDFSAGAEFGNSTLTFYIQNAFDERGILSKNSVCAISVCGAYAREYTTKPQLFGIRFAQRF